MSRPPPSSVCSSASLNISFTISSLGLLINPSTEDSPTPARNNLAASSAAEATPKLSVESTTNPRSELAGSSCVKSPDIMPTMSSEARVSLNPKLEYFSFGIVPMDESPPIWSSRFLRSCKLIYKLSSIPSKYRDMYNLSGLSGLYTSSFNCNCSILKMLRFALSLYANFKSLVSVTPIENIKFSTNVPSISLKSIPVGEVCSIPKVISPASSKLKLVWKAIVAPLGSLYTVTLVYASLSTAVSTIS